MRNKKKIGAFILAGAMVLSMGTSVFAANGDTPPNLNTQGHASITKKFEMSEGLEVPAYTFNFKAEAISPKEAPTATIKPVEYGENNGDASNQDKKKIFTKKTNITFDPFPHAGEYVYKVTETNSQDTGVEYSSEEYELHVYVKNGQNGLEVDMITAKKDAEKVNEIVFTNTYKKSGTLTITKNTKSNQSDGKDFADKTKLFDFTISFQKSATSEEFRRDGRCYWNYYQKSFW